MSIFRVPKNYKTSRLQLKELIEQYLTDLESYCQQDYPFTHPFFWAGFISQGLA